MAPDDEISEGPIVNVRISPTRRLSVGVTAESSETSGYLDPTLSETQELQDNPPTHTRQTADPDTPRPPTPSVPEWCKCGHCRQIPRAFENLCSKKERLCNFDFHKLCLDPDILQLCILNMADIRNDLLTIVLSSSGRLDINNLYWTSIGIWVVVMAKLYHLVLFVAYIQLQAVCIWVSEVTKLCYF